MGRHRDPTLGLGLGRAAALLIVDGLGWRVVAAMFDENGSSLASELDSFTLQQRQPPKANTRGERGCRQLSS
jgi:hypothetical protein